MKKIKRLSLFFVFIGLIGLCSCFDGGGKVTPTQPEHTVHEWSSWNVIQESSCKDIGIERRTCNICGEFEEKQIPQTSHQYQLVEMREGDCINQGYERYECRNCGHSYHNDLPQTDTHDYYVSNTVQPYCDNNGTYDGYIEQVCSRCGNTKTETISNTPCDFFESERIEPTCQTEGYVRYVCTKNNDHFYDEPIDGGNDHIYYYEVYETYHLKRCYNCDYYEDSLVTITNPAGSTYDTYGKFHNYGQWVVEEEATCENIGSKYKQCEECKYQVWEEIPITHKYNSNGVCEICSELMSTEGLVYKLLSDDTYEVTGITTNPEKIVISNYYLGKKVVSIANYTFKDKEFTSIVLPKSVTYYDRYAFYGCNNLVDVYYYGDVEDWMKINFNGENGISTNTVYATPAYTGRSIYFLNEDKEYYKLSDLVIPNTITTINDFSFAQFEQLTSVTFHESIQSIGVGAFVNCDNLESVDVYAKELKAGAFGLCDKLTSANVRNAEELMATFFSCEELVNVTLPNTLKVIGDSTFYRCLKLQSLELPEGLLKIGNGNFYNCDALVNINIPSTVTSYETYNFYSCDNLKYNIIDGMYYLGNETNPKMILFWTGENEIVNYVVDENVRFIEENAIEAATIESITIPSTVIGINYPFINDPDVLNKIITPLFANSLEDYFDETPNLLTNVELLSGDISSYCFENITTLKEVIINDECELDFHSNLFGDNSLTRLTIPYINDIDDNRSLYSILKNTNELEYLEFTKIKSIDTEVFKQIRYIEEIVLPDCLEKVTGSVTDLDYIPFNVLEKGQYLGNKNNPYLVLIRVDGTATSFTLSSDTKVISEGAFSICHILEYTTYKDVNYIGDSDNPFKYAISVNTDNLTKVELHESTEVIYDSFFITKNLDFEFGASVKEIRSNFYSANGELSLYYNGSINDWLNIKFKEQYSNPMHVYQKVYTKENGEYQLLESLILDDSVKVIGDYQFAGLSIKDLILPNDLEYVGKFSFFRSTITGKFDLGNLSTISEHMFQFASITNFKLSDYVVNICDYAFSEIALRELYLPESVEFIGQYAFEFNQIYKLEMYAVDYISHEAFANMQLSELIFNGDVNDWLTITFEEITSNPVVNGTQIKFIKNGLEIDLSNIVLDVEYIGDYQFANFTIISNIELGDKVSEIGAYSFYNTGISTIEFPSRIKYLGDHAFARCQFLTGEIVIPNSVTDIGLGVFEGCSIESIELPFLGDDIDEITDNRIGWIFDDLKNTNKDNHPYLRTLKKVKVYFGEIGDYAFAGCEQIKEILLGEQTSIGDYAFYGCLYLTIIDLSNISYIGEYAFKGCGFLENVYLSSELRNIDKNAFDFEMNYVSKNIYFDGSVEDWCMVNLVESTSNPLVGGGTFYFMVDGEYTVLEKIVVPTNITSLSRYLFAYNENIKEVEIPTSVKYIGEGIFTNSFNIGKITIPYCFDGLEQILGEGYSNNSWYLLNELVLLEGTLTQIYDDYAFAYAPNLRKITLPSNIERIVHGVFDGTYIDEFRYMGTIEQWMNVELENISSNPGWYGSDYYFLQNGELTLATSIEIPESFDTRSKYHFWGCESVIDVYLHKFATGVEFMGCKNIQNVYYKDTFDKWLSTYSTESAASNPNYYGSYFYVYENGEYVNAPSDIVLPTDISIISYNLVGIENIKNITIPANITGISSLYGVKDLENIYYEDAIENWFNFTHPTDVPQHNFYIFNEFNEYELLVDLHVYTSSVFYNFQGIKSLESITFEDPVLSIEYGNFRDLPNLVNVTVKNENITIKERPFINCPNINYNIYDNGLYLGNDNNPYIMFMGTNDKSKKEFIINENSKTYMYGALAGMMNLEKLSTPINVVYDIYYGDNNFTMPESFVEIVYTKSVKLRYTGISSIKKMVFKEAIEEIDEYWYPFREQNLEEIIFEKDSLLKGLSYSSFEFSPNVKFIEYNNGYYLGNSNNPYMILVTMIDKNATSIDIHQDTISILGCAFSAMSNVTEIHIPDSVKAVNPNAFTSCLSLKTVTMKNVEYIGNYAFNGCVNLENLDLGDKLEELGKSVFYIDGMPRCTKLTSLELPSTLKRLNYASLGGLTLDELIIPNSLESMHLAALADSKIKNLTIPFIGEDKDHPSDIKKMYFDLNVLEYLNITNMTSIISEVNLDEAKSLITLKVKTKIIENYGISNLPKLKYLEVEYETLRGKGFISNNPELLEVKLITTFDTIGEEMFNNCPKLSHIDLPETTTVIASKAFTNCTSMEYIVIPESVSTIGQTAFYHVIKLFFEAENLPQGAPDSNALYAGDKWHYVDGVPTPIQN